LADETLSVCTASPQIGLRPAPNFGLPASRKSLNCREVGGYLHVLPCRSWGRAVGWPLRCLIVDDNAGCRDEMRALLEEQGFPWSAAPRAGLRRSAKSVSCSGRNVVLIDIDLCGESGLALTGRLGEGDAGAVVPRMILISTHDECEYADLIEASPAVGFLAKTDLSAATIQRILAEVDWR
jgi:CheY-like chemotaxis protein